MTCAPTTHNDIFVESDVPSQRRVIRQDAMVSNDAVVCNMCIDHQQVVASDLRGPAALNRSPVDRHALTNSVSVAYLDERGLTVIFEVLIFLSDGGKGKDFVVATNASVPAHDNM
jgi:hypothetical protein